MIPWIRKTPPRPQPSSASTSSERLERKFYIPPHAISFAAHLLTHCSLADREYPASDVHSLYFDTDDLEHFNASEQGDRFRKKIRIRWYDDPPTTVPASVFVELKSKCGYAGTKQRRRYSVASQYLQPEALHEGILSYPTLLQVLAEFEYYPTARLWPTILISYKRLRFVDPLTGTRISLDWRVRSRMISPQYDRREGWLSVEGGVIEIKGRVMDLPPMLQSIRAVATDWSRYSKYASCMESHLEEPGSVGRLWPSGRVERT